MKIMIEISIDREQNADEVKPRITIIKAQKDKKPRFKPLTEFAPPFGATNGYVGNTNAAKTYWQGRKTHECGNWGAPNRLMVADGYCKDCRPTGGV